jgi:hypothetical protein
MSMDEPSSPLQNFLQEPTAELMVTPENVSSTEMNLTQEQLIRLEALSQSISLCSYREARSRSIDTILLTAKRFERWIESGDVR